MYCFQLYILTILQLGVYASQSPHIVFIVADDLGWNDVGFRNPAIKTPNINRLANNGVVLNQSYVQPWCSPSRSAFLTGYYPFHNGLQHGVIHDTQPYGLPLNRTTLPQHLQALGYRTSMIGKWHLGFCNWSYTPTSRGFDHFYGYYSGAEDYFTHVQGREGHVHGLDFRDDRDAVWDQQGIYSTYSYSKRVTEVIIKHNQSHPLFLYMAFQSTHSPLQVPKVYENMYRNINNQSRRIFSGMATAMDDTIGNITAALEKSGMMNDTVIIFTTDNGGPVIHGANNWPLRGAKTTIWEGGTRGSAFIHGQRLKKTQYVNNELIHAVDWLPTIVAMAGGTAAKLDSDLDGVNQWPTVNTGSPSARNEFVYNIDDVKRNGAIRVGDYKLIVGNPGKFSDWYPAPSSTGNVNNTVTGGEYFRNIDWIYSEDEDNEIEDFERPLKRQLFNIRDDPTEHHDLSASMPAMVEQLYQRLQAYNRTLVPALDPPPNPRSNPKYWAGVWSPGWC
ncbi:arylsulfatase B [Lingula anatina]|uniref:Arylsulfatase B n=1 Tax=Lingula anatina TaxID=7574 RepID=A0A1S3IP18_LINAN|nr:arylsulfatase B [Lingula anatina]|eukprot:XP_013399823.1 arylsulfatase B [Lingula anatina]